MYAPLNNILTQQRIAKLRRADERRRLAREADARWRSSRDSNPIIRASAQTGPSERAPCAHRATSRERQASHTPAHDPVDAMSTCTETSRTYAFEPMAPASVQASSVGPADAVVLADGTRLWLRPLGSADRDGLAALFARLSPESRYRRFLSPKPTLTPQELAYLTDTDRLHHEAIAAIDPRDNSIVGVGRYTSATRPREPLTEGHDMISPALHMALAQAKVDDLRRAADVHRLAHNRAHPERPAGAERGVTLRFGSLADQGPLARLAELDSAAPPAQPVLLAEVDGQLRAALALTGGAVVADPFYPTADLIDLLHARARQLDATPRIRRSRRLRSWFGRRALAWR